MAKKKVADTSTAQKRMSRKQKPERSKTALSPMDGSSGTTMTILIHGTSDGNNPWYQPGSQFHHYAMQLFSDDYFETDSESDFDWKPALPTNWSRQEGGTKLFHFCQRYHELFGITAFRLVGHSHGASVASICTHLMQSVGVDWTIRRLILLAPLQSFRFPSDHMPNLASLEENCFFNLHARRDAIVWPHRQNFQQVPHLRDHEHEYVVPGQGHWLPTRDDVWKSEPEFVEHVVNGC